MGCWNTVLSVFLWSVASLATLSIPASRQVFAPQAFHTDPCPPFSSRGPLRPRCSFPPNHQWEETQTPRCLLVLGPGRGTGELLPGFQNRLGPLCGPCHALLLGGKYKKKEKESFLSFRNLPNNWKIQRNTCDIVSWHVLNFLHLLPWGISKKNKSSSHFKEQERCH